MARSLFAEDVKVLFTLAKETGIEFSFVEIDPITGHLIMTVFQGFPKFPMSFPPSFTRKSIL